MLLVATDAIERLHEHNVELAFPCVVEDLLIPRAQVACAGHAAIGVGRGQQPLFADGALRANADLILDRCCALQVGRIAGIYAHAHAGSPKLRRCSLTDASFKLNCQTKLRSLPGTAASFWSRPCSGQVAGSP